MNIYRGLLFLQGHLLRPDDAIDAPPSGKAHASVRPLPARPDARSPLGACFSLLESLLFLGGRPMRADRADDVDPPFEQLLRGCGTGAARH